MGQNSMKSTASSSSFFKNIFSQSGNQNVPVFKYNNNNIIINYYYYYYFILFSDLYLKKESQN